MAQDCRGHRSPLSAKILPSNILSIDVLFHYEYMIYLVFLELLSNARKGSSAASFYHGLRLSCIHCNDRDSQSTQSPGLIMIIGEEKTSRRR